MTGRDVVSVEVVEQLRGEVAWLRDQLAQRDAVIREVRHAVRETNSVPATPSPGGGWEQCDGCPSMIDPRATRLRIDGRTYHEGCHQ